MPKGYLALVLHAHLPFVRHPEHSHFLEEDWLYEAITETYVPLISIYDELVREGIDFRITMSMTPPLVAMLTDPLLQRRYVRHIDELIELAEKEKVRTRGDEAFQRLADFYLDRFRRIRHVFVDQYKGNLITAFRKFQDLGVLEIVTCCATHGFLPLMQVNPEAVRAQILVAANHYRHHFGRGPRGIWLAECGYFPGVDAYLAEAGIKYFFTDTHGITHATPRPRHGAHAPIYCAGTGVAAFARDAESSRQVWSKDEGYPGDYNYREFYRDVGYDLPLEYIAPYIQPTGDRKNTGIKYYRVTGKTDQKLPYDPHVADERAKEHAGHFMWCREQQAAHLAGSMGRPPIVVSPYDAELYGHWWYEGPNFLNYLLRKTATESSVLKLTTPAEYLEQHPVQQVATPPLSSWGAEGYASFWLNDTNAWIYPHLHEAAERMIEVAAYPDDRLSPLEERALNQMARELLLAQSSDWAFIMKTGTMVDYANKRTRTHLLRFQRLYEQVRAGRVDEPWLAKVEYLDNIFPEIDFRAYRREGAAARSATTLATRS
ncbi:MAG: 1,4-alpha-glucan branching protein domain-containing protein [Candidatus Sericytochromatia bacterium]|nr:1,4-alpha-glucan branching protein domain-containing protein [Candidatus Sericytochromatia bacterium]